jgi:hypothetical protein
MRRTAILVNHTINRRNVQNRKIVASIHCVLLVVLHVVKAIANMLGDANVRNDVSVVSSLCSSDRTNRIESIASRQFAQ